MSPFRFASALAVAEVAACLVAAPALAQVQEQSATDPLVQEEPDATQAAGPITITGGVTLASQYRFRGISLSDEEFAVSGTINVSHDSGLYAGAYAYSLDGFGERGGADVELDLYAGYNGEIRPGLTLDAGLLYYAYPGSDGGPFEFFEPFASLTYALGPATAKVGVAYAPRQDALGDNDNLYVSGDLSGGIPGTPITLAGHIGRTEGGGGSVLSPGGGYTDYLIGASATFRNLTLGIAYVDTDIADFDAIAVGATPDIVDGALVATLTASF